MSTADGGIAAVLLRLSQLAEQFGSLDEREAAHHRDVNEALSKLSGSGASQGKALVDLAHKLDSLSAAVKSLLPPDAGPGYSPPPPVRWWDDSLPGQDRDKALGRIRRWVKVIYRGQYGRLAAGLGDCWEQHPAAVLQLDWASELWRTLYLQDSRDQRLLSSQAEYGIRILPALAAQLEAETNGAKKPKPEDCHLHGRSREWNSR